MNGCGILVSVGALIWLTILFIVGLLIEFADAPIVPTLIIAVILGNLLVAILIWLFFKVVDRIP